MEELWLPWMGPWEKGLCKPQQLLAGSEQTFPLWLGAHTSHYQTVPGTSECKTGLLRVAEMLLSLRKHPQRLLQWVAHESSGKQASGLLLCSLAVSTQKQSALRSSKGAFGELEYSITKSGRWSHVNSFAKTFTDFCT